MDSVVGTVTGGSTMRLVDLIVAMRSVESARQAGITCSIEPTPEGRRRLQQLLRRVKLRPGQNPAMLEASMKEAFGPQMIQLTGIPADTRFARTLVAADFEMKRVAMGLTDSPVAGSAQLSGDVQKQESVSRIRIRVGGWPVTTMRSPRAKMAWRGSSPAKG